MRGLVLICAGLAACTQFPEIDAAQTPGIERAPYPRLLPIDTLLAGPAPRATPEMAVALERRAAGLDARAAGIAPAAGPAPDAAALKARAAALRGAVVDDATRARMAQGVAEPG
ncbi:hypothetical protein [Roseivivax sp. CAU 1761]